MKKFLRSFVIHYYAFTAHKLTTNENLTSIFNRGELYKDLSIQLPHNSQTQVRQIDKTSNYNYIESRSEPYFNYVDLSIKSNFK